MVVRLKVAQRKRNVKKETSLDFGKRSYTEFEGIVKKKKGIRLPYPLFIGRILKLTSFVGDSTIENVFHSAVAKGLTVKGVNRCEIARGNGGFGAVSKEIARDSKSRRCFSSNVRLIAMRTD